MKLRHWNVLLLIFAFFISVRAWCFSELDLDVVQRVGWPAVFVCVGTGKPEKDIAKRSYWFTPTEIRPVTLKVLGKINDKALCHRQARYTDRAKNPPNMDASSPGWIMSPKLTPTDIQEPPRPVENEKGKWTEKIISKIHNGNTQYKRAKDGKIRVLPELNDAQPVDDSAPCLIQTWEEFTWITCEQEVDLFYRDLMVLQSQTGYSAFQDSSGKPYITLHQSFKIGPQAYYVVGWAETAGDSGTHWVHLMKITDKAELFELATKSLE
jgi:hypothetical protein